MGGTERACVGTRPVLSGRDRESLRGKDQLYAPGRTSPGNKAPGHWVKHVLH